MLQPEGHRSTDLAALGRTAEYPLRDHDGDRVAAIATHNLGPDATDRNSADAAWRRMVETAANANALKRTARIPLTGRKAEHIVAHLILSWDLGQAPEHLAMFEAGRAALGAIGMADRQALLVVHIYR